MKKTNRALHFWRCFGRTVSVVIVCLLCLVINLLGVIWVFEKGPSPSLTELFCRSVRETSALRWIPQIFLNEEEMALYLTESTENLETAAVNLSLIRVKEIKEGQDTSETVELHSVSYGNCKGKLIVVHDPKRVFLGISGEFYNEPGLQLTEMVKKYGGIAGINAGGFVDDNGLGNGGVPMGMVIYDGQLIHGTPDTRYNVIGLDENGILIVGTMTGKAALSSGVVSGVSFVTHDGIASSLIINGEVQTQNLGSGVNPRTALGQRSDGALLLLVLDGRSINTLGASLEDVCDIMLQYGAVNAANLDGGSSSVMVYHDEIINNCASVTGPRSIPTGFIVSGEEAYADE